MITGFEGDCGSLFTGIESTDDFGEDKLCAGATAVADMMNAVSGQQI